MKTKLVVLLLSVVAALVSSGCANNSWVVTESDLTTDCQVVRDFRMKVAFSNPHEFDVTYRAADNWSFDQKVLATRKVKGSAGQDSTVTVVKYRGGKAETVAPGQTVYAWLLPRTPEHPYKVKLTWVCGTGKHTATRHFSVNASRNDFPGADTLVRFKKGIRCR